MLSVPGVPARWDLRHIMDPSPVVSSAPAPVCRQFPHPIPAAGHSDYPGDMPSTVFDLLADETRREILTFLRDAPGGVSVGDIVDKLGVSQPTVSKHLRVLREGGLISVREEGQRRFYSLERAPFEPVEQWITTFAEASPAQQPGPASADEVRVALPASVVTFAQSAGRVSANAAAAVRGVVNRVRATVSATIERVKR